MLKNKYMNFSNKTIWITGASSGIGKALAIELSNQNAKIILSSRRKEDLELVKNACKNPSEVKIVVLDLEGYTNLQPKVDEAMTTFGTIDILVNNGGISQRSFVKDTQIAVDKRIMDINYLGTIALSKAILPHFIKNKKGHFVVTTSIVGKIGTPLRSSYAASKHALHGFFDSLRAEHHQDNISVTLVCPGFVNTNVSKNALTGNGIPQQKMDAATANGIDPIYFAKLMAKAIKNKKEEVYIAGAKEKLAVYAKRFYPKFLSIMIRKLSVT
jgi:dehydrogenase/reductase SDR family protein 7B